MEKIISYSLWDLAVFDWVVSDPSAGGEFSSHQSAFGGLLNGLESLC
ncbi:MAG: hypothetical protein FJ044_00435 [Candidatus Cloacimonetes bacterium]|nr:hypothetical protein [Candidatus Cloacimonadota bacterium]